MIIPTEKELTNAARKGTLHTFDAYIKRNPEYIIHVFDEDKLSALDCAILEDKIPEIVPYLTRDLLEKDFISTRSIILDKGHGKDIVHLLDRDLLMRPYPMDNCQYEPVEVTHAECFNRRGELHLIADKLTPEDIATVHADQKKNGEIVRPTITWSARDTLDNRSIPLKPAINQPTEEGSIPSIKQKI